MKKNIPNFITLGNLLCGCLAIVYSVIDQEVACYFVLAAAVFDVLDGLIARLLHTTSEMGKQLDSLADVVSFGVAPALILILSTTIRMPMHDLQTWFIATSWSNVISLFPLILVLASAWRLAKFNLDTRQSDSFRGLPTPANGLFWIGLVMASGHGSMADLTAHPYALALGSLVFSILMVSDLRLLNLKFKSPGWKGNEARFVLLAAGLATTLWAWLWMKNLFAALPLILLLYLVISVVYSYILKPETHEKIQGRN